MRLLKPTIAEVPSLLNAADESAGVGGSSVDFSTTIVWFVDKNLTSLAYSDSDGPEMWASNRNEPAEPATNAKLSAAPCLNVALEMVKIEMGSELGWNPAAAAAAAASGSVRVNSSDTTICALGA